MKLNNDFRKLRDRHGLKFLRHGKGSHQIWGLGDRALPVSSRGWRHGNPQILENLEKQIRKL